MQRIPFLRPFFRNGLIVAEYARFVNPFAPNKPFDARSPSQTSPLTIAARPKQAARYLFAVRSKQAVLARAARLAGVSAGRGTGPSQAAGIKSVSAQAGGTGQRRQQG